MAVLSFSHSLILSFSHSLILSFSHSLILSFSHSLILSFSHSLILSFSHSLILSFSHLFFGFEFVLACVCYSENCILVSEDYFLPLKYLLFAVIDNLWGL